MFVFSVRFYIVLGTALDFRDMKTAKKELQHRFVLFLWNIFFHEKEYRAQMKTNLFVFSHGFKRVGN